MAFFLVALSTVCMANDKSGSEIYAKITIKNNETGEQKVVKAEVTPSVMTRSVDGSIDAGCDIYIPIDSGISLYTDEGGSKSSGGVTAKLNVNYNLSANNEQIKVNRLYGSWVPDSNNYTLSDRVAAVHSGVISGKKLEKYPTSNSFSYTTGWGYNDRALSTDAGPRAWSEATIHVIGMTATHDITVEFTFGI